MIYSLDETLTFDPFNLDVTITPETIRETLHNREFFKALLVRICADKLSLSLSLFSRAVLLPFLSCSFR